MENVFDYKDIQLIPAKSVVNSRSSISYAGGNKLDAIRHVDYVVVKNSIFNGDKVF